MFVLFANFQDDVNYMYYMIKGYNSLPRLPLEMDKGDTVFFHPLLLHGSGPNLTKVCKYFIPGLCSFFFFIGINI